MTTFDRVLPELLRICEEHTASRTGINRYCVVRDVRGRVRIVVQPQAGMEPELDSLTLALKTELGSYFSGPVLSTGSSGEQQRLAKKLLELDQGKKWPTGWPRSFENVLQGSIEIAADTAWTGIDRTIGKEAWLSNARISPPWPLVRGQTPPVLTFHSFKGGVGRTTLVAAYAVWLAKRDPALRIAVIDLDLEAPGLGSLLNVRSTRGVLDVLIDHVATNSLDLADASAEAPLDGLNGRITVFPAGNIDDRYLQKLARLDYSSVAPGEENPVGSALRAMLTCIKPNFDIILLDSRAGLHDLAGLSLQGLAHIDVLVFRGTNQNLLGLEQTLKLLGAREGVDLLLVETLLPANEPEVRMARIAKTRERVYALLSDYVYVEGEVPQLTDVGEAHDVVPVMRYEWLDGLDVIGPQVEAILANPDFKIVAERLDMKWFAEVEEEVADDIVAGELQ